MKLMLCAVVLLVSTAPGRAVASVTQQIETLSGLPAAGEAHSYHAQVCIFNSTNRASDFLSTWSLNDVRSSQWQRVVIPPQGRALFQLTAAESLASPQLVVRFRNRPYRLQRVERQLAVMLFEQLTDDCDGVPTYTLIEFSEPNGSIYDALVEP